LAQVKAKLGAPGNTVDGLAPHPAERAAAIICSILNSFAGKSKVPRR
jgi:hypothetical protein